MTMTATIKLHRSKAPDDNCPHILVIDDDRSVRAALQAGRLSFQKVLLIHASTSLNKPLA